MGKHLENRLNLFNSCTKFDQQCLGHSFGRANPPWREVNASPFLVKIWPLLTCMMPNFRVLLPHQNDTTASLETKPFIRLKLPWFVKLSRPMSKDILPCNVLWYSGVEFAPLSIDLIYRCSKLGQHGYHTMIGDHRQVFFILCYVCNCRANTRQHLKFKVESKNSSHFQHYVTAHWHEKVSSHHVQEANQKPSHVTAAICLSSTVDARQSMYTYTTLIQTASIFACACNILLRETQDAILNYESR